MGRFIRTLDKLDLAVTVVIVVILMALGLVIARGDQVGLTIESYSPGKQASSRAAIQIVLDEPVAQPEVQQSFAIQPHVSGKLSVSGDQITFVPDAALPSGQSYTVSLHAGLNGTSGRTLKQDFEWQFQVRQPQVLYLAPAGSAIQNLFSADPTNPDHPQQLTQSEKGIYSYTVSPDGSKIAYSEITEVKDPSFSTMRIMMLNVTTGESYLVYDCKAECADLTWRPDGSMIAFMLTAFNTATGAGPAAGRVWLLDLNSNTAQPVFGKDQTIATQPRWSPDGAQLVSYLVSDDVIDFHDIKANTDKTVPASMWLLGSFSPDGHWLAYNDLTVVNDATALHLMVLNLSTNAIQSLVSDDAPVSDEEAVWSSDSQSLIIAREPPASYNPRPSTLDSLNIATGEVKQLVPDDGTTQSELSVKGDWLAFRRTALSDLNHQHDQVWAYNLNTGSLTMIAQDATSPDLLP